MAALWWTVDGRGPAVILLHPGGLDSRTFDQDLPALTRSAGVLRYDRSGSGRSRRSTGAVDRVEELRTVGVAAFGGRPVVLVGSSFGGQLAVDFALAHPGLVTGLLLIAPGLSGVAVSPARQARMARLVAAARRGGDRLTDAWLSDRHLAPNGFSDTTTDLVRAMLRDNARLFVDPPASVAPGDARRRLGELAAPGHVVVGEHDDRDAHAIARRLARDARSLRLQVVAGAGHYPMLERPGWLPEALTRLLNDVTDPAPRV